MAIYSFHLPKDVMSLTPPAADRLRVVKDGFSWLAFIFPLPWLLLNRLWLWSFLFLAANIVLGLAGIWLSANNAVMTISIILLHAFVGLEAGNLKSDALHKRGFVMAGRFAGASREEAELKFFSAAEAA